jgi:hypothetical protein
MSAAVGVLNIADISGQVCGDKIRHLAPAGLHRGPDRKNSSDLDVVGHKAAVMTAELKAYHLIGLDGLGKTSAVSS